MRILVAEDDFISRNLLIKLLQKIGYQVTAAENGAQAWQHFQDEEYEMVITDWMMPEMDGLALCDKIRSSVQQRYVYIIILTARDRKDDLLKVFQSGADDYIPKPFDPDELKARVQTGRRIVELEKDHQRLQEILIESRNKLRIVFDSLQEEIIALDKDKKIVSANKTFLAINGLSYEQIIGVAWLEKAGPQQGRFDVGKVRQLVDRVFEKGEAKHYLDKWVDTRGQIYYKQVTCLPIRDERASVFQVVVVFKDITEERRKSEEIKALNKKIIESAAQIEAKNKKLEAALKRLEETQTQMLQSEKMASIGQLAAGVAHEINNPTGFVSSNLKTLEDYQEDIDGLIQKYRKLKELIEKDGKLDPSSEQVASLLEEIGEYEEEIDIDYIQEDVRDLIKDCREGTERIKKIVMDLKDFAHPGEGVMQATDVNKGLESTLNVVYNELKYKANIIKEFGKLPLIQAYPQQLNQVFMNILVNAAQAIEKKGEIRIKTEAVDGYVRIKISDTGCGIPKENLNKIFDPFFTTKDVGKGTGLGMNIAYGIVKKHNGTIEVESTVGKGTTFTIKLPVDGKALNGKQPRNDV